MTPLHIASFEGHSGISRYAVTFFEQVLKPRGFHARRPGQIDTLEMIDPVTPIHLEIGINEKETTALLYQLLASGFSQLSITLHDPPFLSWPYFNVQQSVLTKLAKFSQLYLKNFGIGERDLTKINKVYVLSRRGLQKTANRYPDARLFHLPFLATTTDLDVAAKEFQPHLLFFGYIAKNKGIEYTLALHKALLVKHPACQLHVVGRPIDAQAEVYYRKLQSAFSTNVNYHGFVPQAEIEAIFARTSLAIMPFEPYRSIVPASASIMDAMCRGQVVCATSVNAVTEFIEDGRTGVLLTNDLAKDAARVSSLLSAPADAEKIASNAMQHLKNHHSAAQVGEAFDRIEPNCGEPT